MGTVNFSGTGTGIDWDVIIEAEIQARTNRTITPLAEWKESWETKISTFALLKSYMSDLLSAVEDIDSSGELRSYAAQSSSPTTVEASVSSTATPGAYTVEINQLAAAETEIHSGLDSAETIVNASGASQYFAYTYAGETTTVEVTAGTTLEDLAALINNDPNNPGVTASILDDGSGGTTSHHLVLRGQNTGADYAITIDAGVTTLAGDWGTLTADASGGTSSVTVDDASSFQQYQAVLIADDDSTAEYHVLSSVAGDTLSLQGTLGDDFTVAQNAYATPRGVGSGLSAAAGSGQAELEVDDASQFQVGATVIVADGGGSEELTISAIDTTTNTLTVETNLTNSYGADAYVTQLEGGRRFAFEDTDFTQIQAAQNAQLRVNGYPASGWIERETNVTADLIPGVTLTLKGTNAGSPATITVSTDPQSVKEKIQAFVDAYNAVKSFLNEQTSYDTSTGQAGALLGNYAANIAESMLREIVINEAPGFTDGVDTYTLLSQVGVQGVSSADGELELGTLQVDETALDEALAEDFEAVVQLFAADFTGRSDSTYLTFYQASGLLTTPGTYDVEADFDGAGNLTGGRIKLSSESSYRELTVDSPYLVGTDDNPEHALYIRATWDGVSTTQSATVCVRQGQAGRMADVLDDMLDTSDGLLHNLDESYRSIVERIDDRIEEEEERLELLRERLTQKYARLEQLMVELAGQETWTTSLADDMSSS